MIQYHLDIQMCQKFSSPFSSTKLSIPLTKCPKRFLLTKCGLCSLHILSELLLKRRPLCSHKPNALNAGAVGVVIKKTVNSQIA